MFSHLKKESMHHAFVVQGAIKQSRTALLDFLKNEFEMGLGHNDVFVFNRGDFGIDDVQEIININSRKPISGDKKILIIELHSISHQAQNALLKTLEEPRPGTYIFILTNTASIFLPTILSRVQVLSVGDTGYGSDVGVSGDDVEDIDRDKGTQNKYKDDQDKKSIKKTSSSLSTALDSDLFIKSSSAQRLAQIKKILDLKADEKIGDAEIFTFVQELEKKAHDYTPKTGKLEDSREVARIFTKVSEYIRDTSSSKKLLLEYVALRLPTF